ncbi:hypothetical protein GCM10027521_54580 [Amycolatopsis cihanbeyliensis]
MARALRNRFLFLGNAEGLITTFLARAADGLAMAIPAAVSTGSTVDVPPAINRAGVDGFEDGSLGALGHWCPAYMVEFRDSHVRRVVSTVNRPGRRLRYLHSKDDPPDAESAARAMLPRDGDRATAIRGWHRGNDSSNRDCEGHGGQVLYPSNYYLEDGGRECIR